MLVLHPESESRSRSPEFAPFLDSGVGVGVHLDLEGLRIPELNLKSIV